MMSKTLTIKKNEINSSIKLYNITLFMKTSIDTGTTLGPYSPGLEITVGNDKMLFISGQLGIDQTNGNLVSANFNEQATQVFKNIGAILEKAGYTFNNIVKLTIYLIDLKNFGAVNETCSKHFTKPFPARATVQIAKLPKDALIEIEAIAFKKTS